MSPEKSWMPGEAVCMANAGTASTTSTPAASAADTPGRRITTDSTAFQNRPLDSRRYSPGTLPTSTRSPSLDSSAGSTVSEPSTATATTRMVAMAKLSKTVLPVRNMPAMAMMTVSPEMRMDRPEVAAAIASARSGSAPFARSSRSRRM
jgi:hypothetical protein